MDQFIVHYNSKSEPLWTNGMLGAFLGAKCHTKGLLKYHFNLTKTTQGMHYLIPI